MNLVGGILGCMELKNIQATQGSMPLLAQEAPLDIKKTHFSRHFTSVCWKIVVMY